MDDYDNVVLKCAEELNELATKLLQQDFVKLLKQKVKEAQQ